MPIELKTLAMRAALIGAAGSCLYSANPARITPRAETARPVAAAPESAPAVVARQAARAVLDGVGVESGLTNTKVETALGALTGKVSKLSDPNALKMAFQAYYRYAAANPAKVKKPYLYFVDYGLDSRTPRGYVFDMKTLEVVDGPFTVAHGRGSVVGGKEVPTRFSNRQGSNATSLGLYLAQETYAFTGHPDTPAVRRTGRRRCG
jgi:hypothetical protein